jgi:hypothetical protein
MVKTSLYLYVHIRGVCTYKEELFCGKLEGGKVKLYRWNQV